MDKADHGRFGMWINRARSFFHPRNRSFKSQLVLSFIFLSIIPLLVVQLVSYYGMTESIRTNVSSLIDLNLRQTRNSLDLMLSGYNDLLYQIYTDDEVIANMESISAGRDIAVNTNQLRRKLASYSDAKPMVKCITMVAGNGAVISYDKLSPTWLKSSWLGAYSQENPHYYKNILARKDTMIFSTGKPTLFGTTYNYLFHMGHRMIDYRSINADAGIAIISLDEALLEDVCSDKANNGARTTVSFLTDGGMLLSFPDRSRIGTQLSPMDAAQYQKLIRGSAVTQGAAVTLSTLRDDYTGWTIVSAVDQSLLFNGMAMQQQMTLLIILILGVALIAFILLLSNRLTGSITKIVKAINRAGEGELNVRIETERTMPVEMKAIATRFNRMLSEINALISDVKGATNKQKEAEIHALEAQINPHFIYNTLDTINWIAIDHSQYEISNMISALAKILRYAVENSNALVTVQDEMDWLRKYVFLQQTRLKSPFEFRMDVDESLLGCRVHKLMIQPFVENAILHGFAGRHERCVLEIHIHAVGESLEIRIQDNGLGLSAETADMINSGSLPDERRKGHIGINNVQERLNMYYGGAASVTAQSGEDGACIVIRMPLIRGEEQTA